MKRKNDLVKHQFPAPIVSMVRSGPQSVLVSCQDGVIYELDLSGRVAPLFDRMPRSAKRCRAGLAVEGVEKQDLIPLFLARAETSDTLLILNGSEVLDKTYLNICLVDLNDKRPPIVCRVGNSPELSLLGAPFFFWNDERIGVPYYKLLILNPQYLPQYRLCDILFDAPPMINNCLKVHPGGREFSACFGEVNFAMYRRFGLSLADDEMAVEIRQEVIIESRGCVQAVAPSPSGKVAFMFIIREESLVRLPDGPKANPMAELGEVVRIDAKGKAKSITVFGDLALDFGVVQFAATSPYKVPKELYRVYPKDNQYEGGAQPTLCPLSDHVVLYPTPGGTILQIDFARQRVRELFQVGFPVQTLLLLGPDGPLAIAGTEGRFWLTELKPRGKYPSNR